jgi:hypothetical protein
MQLMLKCKENDVEQRTILDFHSKSLDEILGLLKTHGEQINETNRIVTNGMQLNITSIKDSIKSMSTDLQGFMTSTREKIVEFEKFNWFRKGMNKFRDHFLFILFITIISIGGALFVLHFDSVAKMIWK